MVVAALVSDDDLMELLVLKGGNALELAHGITERSSLDIDFSIENEIKEEDFERIHHKIEKALVNTFRTFGYEAFDVKFTKKPHRITKDMKDFWGGYGLEFKIIETTKYEEMAEEIAALRKNAVIVGPSHRRRIKVDISKFEYCSSTVDADVEGYTVHVYSLESIVCEKLRAICQQMPAYRKKVKSHDGSARARDFFDIYNTLERFDDLTTKENLEILFKVFKAKRVDLELLAEIPDYREYHREDFAAVRDTVADDVDLRDFDFYFDYVVEKVAPVLKALRIV